MVLPTMNWNGLRIICLDDHNLSSKIQWIPLLFVVFINDLDVVLKRTNLILYADDTVVYYSGKTSEEIIKILNDDIQELGKMV